MGTRGRRGGAQYHYHLQKFKSKKLSNNTFKHLQMTAVDYPHICSILVGGQMCTLLVSLLQEIKAPICKILKLTAVIKYLYIFTSTLHICTSERHSAS